mgnify:CR=1 FL=1
MNKLLADLESQGVIEDDFGPYGAMIVLAAKPNQGHVHWKEYVFRLCVSFRMLNAITRPFVYPIPRCDDEAESMGDCEYAITADLDMGYWQAAPTGTADCSATTPKSPARPQPSTYRARSGFSLTTDNADSCAACISVFHRIGSSPSLTGRIATSIIG